MENIYNILDLSLRNSWSDYSDLQALSHAPDCGLDPNCLNIDVCVKDQ